MTLATEVRRKGDGALLLEGVAQVEAPAETGTLLTNPPYGVRIGEKEALAKFYPELGHLLKQKFTGWNAYIFSGDTDLPKRIRLAATKRTPLYNGQIECRFFGFEVFRSRPGA